MTRSSARRAPRREPAASIIDALGGEKKVAARLGLHRTTVLRFALSGPKCQDGEIPRDYRKDLIAYGRELGVTLTYEDFAWRPESSSTEAPDDASLLSLAGTGNPGAGPISPAAGGEAEGETLDQGQGT